jgi:hypothetical protein
MRIASTQWCNHFFNLITVESGTNSGFGIAIVLVRAWVGLFELTAALPFSNLFLQLTLLPPPT